MSEKRITVQEFANHFGLICINGDENALQREILEVSVNRPGLELAGFFEYPRTRRLIFLGNHELTFVDMLESDRARTAYEFLLSDNCPGIIICQGKECPSLLLELARGKNFPIFLTDKPTNTFVVDSMIYLQDALAPSEHVHACLLEIYSKGVLLLGQSGIGKSELSLELIKKGHHLVSDDRVDISLIRGKLYGESPELLRGMIEVRGIGIIDVTRMFGVNSLTKRVTISYAIELVKLKPGEEMERLGNYMQYYEILGRKIPLLKIPVIAGRNMSEIIETAVTNLKLKDDGFDSTMDFESRYNELLLRKQDN